jgi:hypothetical protein
MTQHRRATPSGRTRRTTSRKTTSVQPAGAKARCIRNRRVDNAWTRPRYPARVLGDGSLQARDQAIRQGQDENGSA